MIIPMLAPLTLRRNDNPFRVTFVAEDEDGSVIDMTGVTAKLQMRLEPGSPGDPLIEATTGELTGTRLIASALGIEAVILNEPIDTLPSGSAGKPIVIHYDLLITKDGDENAWFYGPVTVEWGVVDV